MARPRKVIDKKQFETLCSLGCTQMDICQVLDVNTDTLSKWCKETYEMGFSDIYEQKKGLLKASIRKSQVDLAKKGNSTMLIWLGKNLVGQSESPIQDEIKLKELDLKIKEFELKEKLMLKQLEEGSTQSDVAQALREVFGTNENNK